MSDDQMIRRRFNLKVLTDALECRRRLLKACHAPTLRSVANRAEQMVSVSEGFKELALHTDGLPEAEVARWVTEVAEVATCLCDWVAATLAAAEDAPRLLSAAKARAVSLKEVMSSDGGVNKTNSEMHESLEAWLSDVVVISDVSAVPNLIQKVALFPFPLFFSKAYDPYGWLPAARQEQQASAEKETEFPVVKLLFSLDGVSLDTSQVIRSNVQYDLSLLAHVVNWPDKAQTLKVDYISIMDPRYWSVTPFSLSPVESTGRINSSGHVIMPVSQSLISAPNIFKVRAQFLSEDGNVVHTAVVIGHSEMRLQPLDESSYPVLTQYPVIDIQVMKILQDAKDMLPNIRPSDFADFQASLIYLARYAGMVQQTGVFKSGNFKGKRIDEKKDFQQHLLQHLRMTALGSGVQEGENTAGGLLDLRYRNIVIELKVEDNVKDRVKLRKKYIEQPTQYSASGMPLSITCILDMTPKDNPPANVANNITLETATTHGFEDNEPPYPAKVAVIIIDGNTKLPSDYS